MKTVQRQQVATNRKSVAAMETKTQADIEESITNSINKSIKEK